MYMDNLLDIFTYSRTEIIVLIHKNKPWQEFKSKTFKFSTL